MKPQDDPYQPPESPPPPREGLERQRPGWHFVIWWLPAVLGWVTTGIALAVLPKGGYSGGLASFLTACYYSFWAVLTGSVVAGCITGGWNVKPGMRKLVVVLLFMLGIAAMNCAIAYAGCAIFIR